MKVNKEIAACKQERLWESSGRHWRSPSNPVDKELEHNHPKRAERTASLSLHHLTPQRHCSEPSANSPRERLPQPLGTLCEDPLQKLNPETSKVETQRWLGTRKKSQGYQCQPHSGTNLRGQSHQQLSSLKKPRTAQPPQTLWRFHRFCLTTLHVCWCPHRFLQKPRTHTGSQCCVSVQDVSLVAPADSLCCVRLCR